MSFDWHEYLELAELLVPQGSSAAVRSAVSRAYYAAFCTAQAWLDSRNLSYAMNDPAQSHRAVWDAFNRGPERQKKQIANVGGKLKASRVLADYKADASISVHDASTAVERARQILKLLSELK